MVYRFAASKNGRTETKKGGLSNERGGNIDIILLPCAQILCTYIRIRLLDIG